MSRKQHGRLFRILGGRLAAARESVGLTQTTAAERLGWSQSPLSRMESGDREVSAFELRDMSRLYRVAMEELLADPTADEKGKSIMFGESRE